jgi:type VI secretion system secreted protein VgrG
MTPKSGKSGSVVAPAAPESAAEADNAEPGQVSTVQATPRQSRAGTLSGVNAPAFVKPPPEEVAALSWIEIELVDEDDKPVPGEAYEVTLSDQTVAGGTLDEKGFARVEGVPPGQCTITFPNRDKDAISKIS